jgi:hypothetical protein
MVSDPKHDQINWSGSLPWPAMFIINYCDIKAQFDRFIAVLEECFLGSAMTPLNYIPH